MKVKKATDKCKSGKGAGVDGVTAEMLKYEGKSSSISIFLICDLV